MLSTTINQATDQVWLRNLQQQIHDNADAVLDRGALARLAGFSIPHLQRLFHRQFGKSLAAYARRARIHRAARKLRMGAVDITEVALAAGFKTHSAFSKAFKRELGVSPRDFRHLGCAAATVLLRKGNQDANITDERID